MSRVFLLMRLVRCSTLALLGVVLNCTCVSAREYRVTIGSASRDRMGQVVEFKLPADAETKAVHGAGGDYPLQVDADRTARFIVPAQKAGETLQFVLAATSPAPATQVQTKSDGHALHVTVAGAPVFDFRTDREQLPRDDIKPEFKRAGYIHPVFSPSGKIVTDDYPSNHVHHHGIWTPWTKTKFQGRSPDFWNMGAKTGAEDFVGLDQRWSGPVHGGFVARLKMVDLTAPGQPVVALNEIWKVTAYNLPVVAGEPSARMFDLEFTQTCATNDPLELPKYHYGGFGFRGATQWNGAGDAALFLTSEGETDRVKGNDTRGRWCFLGGKIDGAITGTAILGHPANFRAPQTMRLHPNMPYMSYVPQALGDFAIEPGKPYVARFRFVVSDGAPDAARIEAYWQGYATPAVVKISAAP